MRAEDFLLNLQIDAETKTEIHTFPAGATFLHGILKSLVEK